jgi:hypothetical protein
MKVVALMNVTPLFIYQKRNKSPSGKSISRKEMSSKKGVQII